MQLLFETFRIQLSKLLQEKTVLTYRYYLSGISYWVLLKKFYNKKTTNLHDSRSSHHCINYCVTLCKTPTKSIIYYALFNILLNRKSFY